MSDQSFEKALEECRRGAVAAGTLEPQGFRERMASGIMAHNGQWWSDTPLAQQRYNDWVRNCLKRKGFDV